MLVLFGVVSQTRNPYCLWVPHLIASTHSEANLYVLSVADWHEQLLESNWLSNAPLIMSFVAFSLPIPFSSGRNLDE